MTVLGEIGGLQSAVFLLGTIIVGYINKQLFYAYILSKISQNDFFVENNILINRDFSKKKSAKKQKKVAEDIETNKKSTRSHCEYPSMGSDSIQTLIQTIT